MTKPTREDLLNAVKLAILNMPSNANRIWFERLEFLRQVVLGLETLPPLESDDPEM